MNDIELKRITAARVIEIALLRRNADLSDGALRRLSQEATSCIAFEDHIATGADLSINECLDAAVASDIGKLIFAARDDVETGVADALPPAHLSPAAKINWARDNGLA